MPFTSFHGLHVENCNGLVLKTSKENKFNTEKITLELKRSVKRLTL